MTNDPDKPKSPWQLNSSRVVLLVLGVLLVLIMASTLLGGLNNYQQLREGAKEQTAPVESAPAPAN